MYQITHVKLRSIIPTIFMGESHEGRLVAHLNQFVGSDHFILWICRYVKGLLLGRVARESFVYEIEGIG